MATEPIKKIASEETETGTIIGCDHSSPFFPCAPADSEKNSDVPFTPTYRHEYTIRRTIYGYHSDCSCSDD